MSEARKPREWTLHDEGDYFSVAGPSPDAYLGEPDVKVIERSAFDQVVKERDDLKRLWQSVADRVMPGEQDTVETVLAMLRERDELRAELERLTKVTRRKEDVDPQVLEIWELKKAMRTAIDQLQKDCVKEGCTCAMNILQLALEPKTQITPK